MVENSKEIGCTHYTPWVLGFDVTDELRDQRNRAFAIYRRQKEIEAGQSLDQAKLEEDWSRELLRQNKEQRLSEQT